MSFLRRRSCPAAASTVPPALVAKLLPPREPLRDLLLEAERSWRRRTSSRAAVRQVLLRDVRLRHVVRVLVPLVDNPVPSSASSARCGCAAAPARRGLARGFAAPRPAPFDAVRLRRRREVDRPSARAARYPSGEPSMWYASRAATASLSACGSARPMSSAAIAIARRKMYHRVLAALDHARQPVQRALRIAAAQRLVVRASRCCSAPRRPCRSARSAAASPRAATSAVMCPPAPTCSAAASSTVSARRASPSASAASSVERVVVDRQAPARRARARCRSSARRSSRAMSAGASGSSTNTRTRDSSAPLISNDGFSVVAPISVTVPLRRAGETRPAAPC